MTIGAALALLSLPIFGIGVFHLFRPTTSLTRGKAGLVMLGAFLLFVTGALIDDPPPTNAPAPAAVESRTDQASVAPAPTAAVSAQTDMENLWRSVLRIARPCDEANTAAANAVLAVSEGNATMFDAYAPARRAQQACENSWQEIDRLEPPASLAGEAARKATSAIEVCQTAYFSRKEALEGLMVFLDGDSRPSVVENYREQAELAQTAILLCVARLMEAAMEVGAELPGSGPPATRAKAR